MPWRLENASLDFWNCAFFFATVSNIYNQRKWTNIIVSFLPFWSFTVLFSIRISEIISNTNHMVSGLLVPTSFFCFFFFLFLDVTQFPTRGPELHVLQAQKISIYAKQLADAQGPGQRVEQSHKQPQEMVWWQVEYMTGL